MRMSGTGVSWPATAYPFVSVIVPLFNDTRRVEKLLASLEKQSYPREHYEVIVVDNGSDQEVGHLRSRFRIRMESETRILSSYAARNEGIRVAKGDVLCFTDSDCLVHEDWIKEGVNALKKNNAHMVGGDVIFTMSSRKRASEYYDAITNMQIESIVKNRGVAITANLFVTRKVIEKTGIFPYHVKSGGDIYFTAEAVRAGFKLVYSPGAYVYHPARDLGLLIKKGLRVGLGKSALGKLLKIGVIKNIDNSRLVQSRKVSDHLNPMNIKRRLQKNGYRVGTLKFLSILWVSYCYLFSMLVSRVWGSLKH